MNGEKKKLLYVSTALYWGIQLGSGAQAGFPLILTLHLYSEQLIVLFKEVFSGPSDWAGLTCCNLLHLGSWSFPLGRFFTLFHNYMHKCLIPEPKPLIIVICYLLPFSSSSISYCSRGYWAPYGRSTPDDTHHSWNCLQQCMNTHDHPSFLTLVLHLDFGLHFLDLGQAFISTCAKDWECKDNQYVQFPGLRNPQSRGQVH